MKKWKITEKSEMNRIESLLNEYSKSLSECTSNVLNSYYTIKIILNNIHYYFIITNKDRTFDIKLFEISLKNMDGYLLLTIKYFDEIHNTEVNINDLESKLDDIIQSNKMSNYIGHLINCSKIQTK